MSQKRYVETQLKLFKAWYATGRRRCGDAAMRVHRRPHLRQSGAARLRRRAAARGRRHAGEARAHFLREFDWIRTGLMFEPRGHDMMSGSILYPPTRPDCDVAVLFIETSGCLPMCGHGTIGTITMGIENGLITPRDAGAAVDRRAGRQGRHHLPPGGPLRRGGAPDQRPRLPLRRGADRRGRGAGRDRGRRRLWRQLLRHRRAAEEFPRHGRLSAPASWSAGRPSCAGR